MTVARALVVAMVIVVGSAVGAAAQGTDDLATETFDPGTPADRAALFDFLIESTMEWDAFASLSRGAYAVQRIQSRPFRTTFGNLMVSEAMERWVANRIQSIRSNPASAPETVDGGKWLLEWLEDDVQRAIETGNRYTNDVPFKGAHARKWADGIIDPAPVHFCGGLTVWMSSHSGSHKDQFSSQIADNDLGHMMGMPAGGFSNTWQTTEVLRFPTTGQPVVEYMRSMDHSIRPNREILQYNPAPVDEYIPQTRDNYFDYHPGLLRRTLERLGMR